MGGLFDKFLLDDEPPATKTYDDDEEYFTLQDKKLEQEIRKLKIQNEKELGNLVSRDLVKSILLEVGQQIQTNFVDLPRRESPNLSAELGIPNKERDLEKLWSDLNRVAIESCINNIDKLVQDGTFE